MRSHPPRACAVVLRQRIAARAARPPDRGGLLHRRRVQAAVRPAAVEHVGDRHVRPRRAVRRGPVLRARAGDAREGLRGAVRRGDGDVTNVVLIVFDSARRDALEPSGAPAVADLGRRGVVARNAHSAACWTLPSHAAMFTGLMPRAAGLARAPARTPQSCRPVVEEHRDRLLPEVFRRAGHATAGVSANLWISETSGFDHGFGEFRSVESGRQSGLHDPSPRARARWALEAARARADDGAGAAREVVRGWTHGARADRPFFWFVNLNECHSPY